MSVNANQLGQELLTEGGAASVRADQLGAELVVSGGSSIARVDQVGIEALVAIPEINAPNVFAVTVMPAQPGPSSIQVTLSAQTAASDSPYSGEVLTGAYETTYTEIVVYLPDIQDPTWQAEWLAWLTTTCKQQAVFLLQPQIEGLIPANYSTSWWRLKPGPVEIDWTVGSIIESLTFTVRSLSVADAAYV